MPRILLADDEERIASFITKGLSAAGYSVDAVGDGQDALDAVSHSQYDLLILDVGLPTLDGFAVLRRLRNAGSELPVVMLTARDSIADTVAGFDGGADDYITKPFRFDELLVRVRARLRRPPVPATDPMTLVAGGIELDLRGRRALVEGRTIDLSGREFELLEQLMLEPGRVMSREQLLSRVWRLDFDPGSNIVDAYVKALRRKVGADRIVTVRGAGYRLAASP